MSKAGVGERLGRLLAAAAVVEATILPPASGKTVSGSDRSALISDYEAKIVEDCRRGMEKLLVPKNELEEKAKEYDLAAMPWGNIEAGWHAGEKAYASSAVAVAGENMVEIGAWWRSSGKTYSGMTGRVAPILNNLFIVVDTGKKQQFLQLDLKEMMRRGVGPDTDLRLGFLSGGDQLSVVVGVRKGDNWEYRMVPWSIFQGNENLEDRQEKIVDLKIDFFC